MRHSNWIELIRLYQDKISAIFVRRKLLLFNTYGPVVPRSSFQFFFRLGTTDLHLSPMLIVTEFCVHYIVLRCVSYWLSPHTMREINFFFLLRKPHKKRIFHILYFCVVGWFVVWGGVGNQKTVYAKKNFSPKYSKQHVAQRGWLQIFFGSGFQWCLMDVSGTIWYSHVLTCSCIS